MSARLALTLAAAGAVPAVAQDWSLRPEIALEGRLFPRSPAFEDQLETFQGGPILGGEARWRSAGGDVQARVEPYLRLDSADGERTYADLREASVSVAHGDWALLAGFGKVFWGVAESRNVVDVINQFDAVEGVDEDEKLGQPMLRLSRRVGSGVVEAYWLPVFRERAFPGRDGRLRTDPVVDADAARYERGGEEFAGDLALRHAGRFGDVDLGLHGFHGTNRAPRLDFDPVSGRFTPVYHELSQAGIDVQYTTGPWLLKAEAVAAEIGGDRFAASVVGFEYTVFDVRETGLDLGLIGEHLYDDRDQNRSPATPFEDDLFGGVRLTLNDAQDTELLAGAIVDAESGAAQVSAEFQRRLGDAMLLEIEARAFDAQGDPLIEPLRRDNVLTLRLTRYF